MTVGHITMNLAMQHDTARQNLLQFICTDVDQNPAGEFWFRILLAALIIYKADGNHRIILSTLESRRKNWNIVSTLDFEWNVKSIQSAEEKLLAEN